MEYSELYDIIKFIPPYHSHWVLLISCFLVGILSYLSISLSNFFLLLLAFFPDLPFFLNKSSSSLSSSSLPWPVHNYIYSFIFSQQLVGWLHWAGPCHRQMIKNIFWYVISYFLLCAQCKISEPKDSFLLLKIPKNKTWRKRKICKLIWTLHVYILYTLQLGLKYLSSYSHIWYRYK